MDERATVTGLERRLAESETRHRRLIAAVERVEKPVQLRQLVAAVSRIASPASKPGSGR